MILHHRSRTRRPAVASAIAIAGSMTASGWRPPAPVITTVDADVTGYGQQDAVADPFAPGGVTLDDHLYAIGGQRQVTSEDTHRRTFHP
jgi:hypothetical protein